MNGLQCPLDLNAAAMPAKLQKNGRGGRVAECGGLLNQTESKTILDLNPLKYSVL
jgi:hypothetical protein